MDNTAYDIKTLINDLDRISKTARTAWINCLDPESLSIVRAGVEAWNEYCDLNGWTESKTDFEEFASEKTWCIELLVESLESI